MACYYIVISSTHLRDGQLRSIKGVFRGPIGTNAQRNTVSLTLTSFVEEAKFHFESFSDIRCLSDSNQPSFAFFLDSFHLLESTLSLTCQSKVYISVYLFPFIFCIRKSFKVFSFKSTLLQPLPLT